MSGRARLRAREALEPEQPARGQRAHPRQHCVQQTDLFWRLRNVAYRRALCDRCHQNTAHAGVEPAPSISRFTGSGLVLPVVSTAKSIWPVFTVKS